MGKKPVVTLPAEIPILMYHRIRNADVKPSTVSIDRFRAQMRYLAQRRFCALTCTQLSECIAAGRPLPPRPVVITFDDGYRDNHDNAFPILREFDFTATVFLVLNGIGKWNAWETDPSVPRYPMMGLSEIRKMAEAGIEFGSHTLNHVPLNQVPPDQAEKEIVESKRRLEDLLGKPVTSFCYPYNGYNAAIKKQVSESGYTSACTAGSGQRPVAGKQPIDLFELRRIFIPQPCGLFEYRMRVSGYYLFFKDLGDKNRRRK